MSTLTFGMGLILPTIGVDTGLFWEQSMNTNSGIINNHDHSPGSGQTIDATGIDLTSDLTFNSNNAIGLRSVRFVPQSLPLSLSADLNCAYVAGIDLYFNDGSGRQIQITSGGAVNATSSGISNGTATASFVSSILTVLAAPNTPAAIRGGSYLMGNTGLTSSNYLTLNPPNPIPSNYTLTWPLPPPATETGVLVIDDSGTITSSVVQYQAFVPTGGVIPFAGTSAPAGFLLAQGGTQLIASYPALYAVIGTHFGGDGITTFGIPNCVNSAPFGIGSRFTLGQTGGSLDPSLNTLVNHNHTVNDPGHDHLQNVSSNTGGGPGFSFTFGGSGQTGSNVRAAGNVTGISLSSTGNSASNGNMPPFIGMNYIIKT